MKKILILIIIATTFVSCNQTKKMNHKNEKTLRVATFNTALYRNEHGILKRDLETGNDEQIKIIAEIIQRAQPDILVLQEFDYDARGEYLKLFQTHYLSKSQNNSTPINYPYVYAVPSNTGIMTMKDLNNDKKKHTPNDCYGYGKYPGQYAFSILSKYPIDQEKIRTFQHFLWKDMPQALLPLNEDYTPFLTDDALSVFRLSSKNHVDVPVNVNGKIIHVLAAHPTPPVFDGKENLNGKRNHDEIRLIADYISDKNNDYLYDDKGKKGGIEKNSSFIIFGDMNADPNDGEAYDNAIDQLLTHPKVNKATALGEKIPMSKEAELQVQRISKKGKLKYHTSVFGLRLDYVLPSSDLSVKESGVYWLGKNDKLNYLTQGKKGSDHRLVWVDIDL